MIRFSIAVCILVNVFLHEGKAQDTVHVYSGWNIVGSSNTGAVSEILVSDPPGIITTAFYGYTPNVGYQELDTLEDCVGYWIKVSADGLIIFSESGGAEECGLQRLVYGGKIYHTVKIGGQCWLEENLDVGTMITGASNQTDNATIEKYCYDNDPLNCVLYGGLYQWGEAMQYASAEGTQGICPTEWHLPTHGELIALYSTVGGNGNALKAIGQGTGSGAGTNTSGFSALLSGIRFFGVFGYLGTYTYFWSSTEYNVSDGYMLGLQSDNGTLSVTINDKTAGQSVRCIRD